MSANLARVLLCIQQNVQFSHMCKKKLNSKRNISINNGRLLYSFCDNFSKKAAIFYFLFQLIRD